MLTCHATVKDDLKAMKLGAEDFLEKPVDLELLLEKIHGAKSKRMLVLEQKSKDKVSKIITRKGW